MKICIYALDAGGSFLKCGLVDEDLRVIPGSHDKEAADSSGGSPESIRAAYRALAARAKARAAAAGYEISAVGMDTPGPFDYKTGTFRMTHKYTALYGMSVLPWFGEDFPGLRVHIMHDSAAFILGASRALPDGADSRGCVAAVMLGTGLGFALMRDGKPLLAENGGPAVSIYRAPLHGTEAEEPISARGIVRRYADAAGIAGRTTGHMPDAREIAERAAAGDATAAQVYAETGSLLGELLAPILGEYGAHTLMLGGQISRDAALFLPELRRALGNSRISIAEAANAEDAHLIGAAMGAIK